MKKLIYMGIFPVALAENAYGMHINGVDCQGRINPMFLLT